MATGVAAGRQRATAAPSRRKKKHAPGGSLRNWQPAGRPGLLARNGGVECARLQSRLSARSGTGAGDRGHAQGALMSAGMFVRSHDRFIFP